MVIPKYVKEMMGRSSFYYCFDGKDERCAAGYTVAIKKATPYTYAETLFTECERLKKWVERQPGGICHIISTPKRTTHGDQLAIVTIFDPVMKHLEKYIHP